MKFSGFIQKSMNFFRKALDKLAKKLYTVHIVFQGVDGNKSSLNLSRELSVGARQKADEEYSSRSCPPKGKPSRCGRVLPIQGNGVDGHRQSGRLAPKKSGTAEKHIPFVSFVKIRVFVFWERGFFIFFCCCLRPYFPTDSPKSFYGKDILKSERLREVSKTVF